MFSTSVFGATSIVNSKKYTHPAFYKTKLYRLFHGVDVSYWQGSINWNKSKRDGIDFAILRCGYTALNKFALHQDSTFMTNYQNAKDAGVSVGIYYYACATTSSEAQKEANYVISILKNNNINNQLPVVMDYEIDSGRANTVYKSLVNKKGKDYARKRFTNNAKKFLNTLKAAGYEAMFYSYRVMIDPSFSSNYRFNMSEINGSNQYRFWLAQYSTSNSYSGNMELWQFSSTGKVSGMKGNIDRNFWYYPLSGIETASGTTSIRGCKVKLSTTEYKYDGTVKEPAVKVVNGDTTLTENTDYSVSYMNNIKKGTATVLVHGKGSYSNETYSTFKIGDKDNGTDKITVTDEPADEVSPSKIKNVTVKYNLKKGKIKLSWDADENSTKYQVAYKVNGADKMTKETTEKTSYTITGLNKGDIVEALVRGQSEQEGAVINGKYSTRQFLYLQSQDNKSKLLKNNKVKVSWNNLNESKGALQYKVSLARVNSDVKTYDTTRTNKKIKVNDRYCYDIYVTPVLVRDGHSYKGTAGNKTQIYVTYGNIKKAVPVKGGFKIRYAKTSGKGSPEYRILYSTNKELKNAKEATQPQDKTLFKATKLGRKKTYYVAMQSYKVIDGVTYYGVMSPTVKVATK